MSNKRFRKESSRILRKVRASGYALINPKHGLVLVVPEVHREFLVRSMWKQAFPNEILLRATDQEMLTHEAIKLGWRVVPVLIKETTGGFDAKSEAQAEAGTVATGETEVLDRCENKE
jgi:hypothetical protein